MPSVTLELERTEDKQEGLAELSSREWDKATGTGEVKLASSQTTKYGGGGGVSPLCLSCHSGISCRKCLAGSPLLDRYATTARKATPALGGSEVADKSRRVRRFYQRYFTGVGVGGRLRILTLTTSDEAIDKGLDIHRSFRALKERLRRRWGRFEYMGVREVKGDRQHLHLVFRGEYMEQVQLSAMWSSLHHSPVVDIRAVWGSRGGARYLAKYLSKSASSRYWASYNWVFQGWVGWSKRVKRAFGHYPARGLLQALARQDKTTRNSLLDYWGVALGGVKPFSLGI